jgi:hypothetical protein
VLPRPDNTEPLPSKVDSMAAADTVSHPPVVQVGMGSSSSRKAVMGRRHRAGTGSNQGAMASSSSSSRQGGMVSSSKAATEDLLRLANRARVAILLSKVGMELLLHHDIDDGVFFSGL